MNTQLVECVPNFSEGRNTETIEAICAEVEAVPGVFLLDRHIDPDHNRTVLSFIGEPQQVERAAVAAVGAAIARIDLRQHSGVHPRMGAVDVLPLIPYQGISLEQTIALARSLAARIGDAYDLPVYLYADASDGVRLASIRRDPAAHQPDFGPATLHPTAGATAVGVRPFLVAYNVVLDTDRLDLARQIASQIRSSSGGLPGVQALGFRLESRGKVQVSMNLIDLERTGISAAHQAVATRAAEAGVALLEDELVGLAPSTAVSRAAGLPERSQIEAALLPQLLSPSACALPLLERLASADATPGGGAVVALSAAMAAAQVEMLTHLTSDKHQAHRAQTGAFAGAAWRTLYGLIEQDQQGFRQLLEAYKLAKDDPQRPAALEAGQQAASTPPLQVLIELQGLLSMLGPLGESARAHLLPDLAIAIHTALAAAEGAAGLVRINLVGCETHEWARSRAAQTDDLLARTQALAANLLSHIDSRMS